MSPELTAQFYAYLPLIIAGLVALVIAAWTVSRMNRKARVLRDDDAAPLVRDVLDDGAGPALRNQALIDAPRSIEIIQGDLSAAANSQPTGAVPMGTDNEAGPEIAPITAAAPTSTPDDLTRIKGLGPKLAALLGEFGITTFAQIAAWEPDEIERIDAKLGRFSGRITRDQWVAQAKLLAAGEESAFAAQFGRNG